MCVKRFCGKIDYKKITKAYILFFSLFVILFSCYGPLYGCEYDSYLLPTISLQYRGSLVINETDYVIAAEDFPEIINGENYIEEKSTGLLKTKDGTGWTSYYFPIYSFLCIPIKLLLQALKFPQIRCFTLTNGVFIILTLLLIYKKMSISDGKKLFCIASLTVAPILHYLSLTSAEIFIFCCVVAALVFYHEKCYKRAGFIISLAGACNPTIMAFGAVMIANYLIEVFTSSKGMKFTEVVKKNFFNTLKLAACYLPCFSLFIMNYVYVGSFYPTAGSLVSSIESTPYFGRFVSYFFDLNFGFATFAIVPLFVAIISLPFLIAKKKFNCLYYYVALIFTFLAFSLTSHINCGMNFCARYVFWSYPILIFICAAFCSELIKIKYLKTVLGSFVYVSLVVFMFLNSVNGKNVYFQHYKYNNTIANFVLDNFPQLYNPLYSTFYSRELHVDGAYGYRNVAAHYDTRNGEVRKLILTGTKENKDYILENYVLAEGDYQKFEDVIKAIPEDGKYRYINFPPNCDYQIRLADVKDKGVVTDSRVIFESGDISYTFNPDTYLYRTQIDASPDTYYKINFSFDEETVKNFNDVTRCYVDLWASGTYDSNNTEIPLYSDVTDYEVYIRSENMPEDVGSLYARLLFTSKEESYILDSFTVTEMNYTGVGLSGLTFNKNYGFTLEEGFYETRSNEDGDTWNWCNSEGTIKLFSITNAQKTIKFTPKTSGSTVYNFYVEYNGKVYTYPISNKSEEIVLSLDVPAGHSELKVYSDCPQVIFEKNTAVAYFRIINFTFE